MPASFANNAVSVGVYPERIVVVAEGHAVCEHPRIIAQSHDQPGRTIYDWRHEAPQALTLEREPRADVDRYDSLRDAMQETRHAS